MRTLFTFMCVLALGVMGCSETSGAGGSAGDGGGRDPLEVRIDTYNVALTGALSPSEMQRRQPLLDAIAGAESDILCLEEVSDRTDKEAVRDAAIDSFPYIVWVETDLDTPLDDPTDQNGEVPPAPTTVPCPRDVEVSEGVSVADQMDGALDCVRDACSTIPGSDDGRTTTTSCASAECLGSVAVLIFGDEQQQRCYTCLATQLPNETFGTIRERCPSVVNQELPYQGQHGVMLLSRYPLENPEVWVLPGTWSRRAILSATAKLPNGAELDLFCNHFSFISESLAFPYLGQYGDGARGPGPEGWMAEQLLQGEKLVAHVQEKSANRAAIVLGDFNATRAYPDIGVVAEGQETLELLEGAFTPAYTPDYAPACTFCDTNPLTSVDPDESLWIDHIFLHNLPAEAVKETVRTFDDNGAVDIGDGQTVPLSDHYGMRSVIEVR